MKFYFFVEDSHGSDFITVLFKKNSGEGLLSGNIVDARRYDLSNKLRRMVNAAIHLKKVDRVIILRDADGRSLDKEIERIKQYLDPRYLRYVHIVLLDYEIEEWICYSQGIPVKGEKPSKILKHRQKYQKNRLPKFAEKLDCKKLAGCPSFLRLTCALKSA